MGIKEAIERAETEIRANTGESGTAQIFRGRGERSGLNRAWTTQGPNRLFLHLFERSQEVPFRIYRVSFPFPLVRITVWEYPTPLPLPTPLPPPLPPLPPHEDQDSNESIKTLLETDTKNPDFLKEVKTVMKQTPKKITLEAFFTTILMLKKSLLKGAFASDQVTFVLNDYVLTEGPITIIDYFVCFYKHRQVDQAMEYAQKRSQTRRMRGLRGDSRILNTDPSQALEEEWNEAENDDAYLNHFRQNQARREAKDALEAKEDLLKFGVGSELTQNDGNDGNVKMEDIYPDLVPNPNVNVDTGTGDKTIIEVRDKEEQAKIDERIKEMRMEKEKEKQEQEKQERVAREEPKPEDYTFFEDGENEEAEREDE